MFVCGCMYVCGGGSAANEGRQGVLVDISQARSRSTATTSFPDAQRHTYTHIHTCIHKCPIIGLEHNNNGWQTRPDDDSSVENPIPCTNNREHGGQHTKDERTNGEAGTVATPTGNSRLFLSSFSLGGTGSGGKGKQKETKEQNKESDQPQNPGFWSLPRQSNPPSFWFDSFCQSSLGAKSC